MRKNPLNYTIRLFEYLLYNKYLYYVNKDVFHLYLGYQTERHFREFLKSQKDMFSIAVLPRDQFGHNNRIIVQPNDFYSFDMSYYSPVDKTKRKEIKNSIKSPAWIKMSSVEKLLYLYIR